MMRMDPKVGVMRFEQLSPGDLFIYPYDEGSCVAMKVVDPTSDGDILMLPLGPMYPAGVTCPSLMHSPAATVISFGKEYTLRLPCRASGWLASPPPFDKHGIAVTEKGAYVRANRLPAENEFHACYVDMATGAVHVSGGGRFQQFAPPPRISAFAIEWEIVTVEKEPRVILAYP
jgi:hypothetical protein